MAASFTPSFQHLQKDIEALLKNEGKRTKNAFGQEVFHGYDDALERMYRAYMAHAAHAPLVAEFRKWNSEWEIDPRIEELTVQLLAVRDWPLLHELWTAVVAKRRTNYNRTRDAFRKAPGTIPAATMAQVTTLLSEAIDRLISLADTLERGADVADFRAMSEKASRGAKA